MGNKPEVKKTAIKLLRRAYSEEIEFLKKIIENDKNLQKELHAKEIGEYFERGLKEVTKKDFGTAFTLEYMKDLRIAINDENQELMQQSYNSILGLVVFGGKIRLCDEYMKKRKAANEFKATMGKEDEVWVIDFILGERTDFKELKKILRNVKV